MKKFPLIGALALLPATPAVAQFGPLPPPPSFPGGGLPGGGFPSGPPSGFPSSPPSSFPQGFGRGTVPDLARSGAPQMPSGAPAAGNSPAFPQPDGAHRLAGLRSG